MLRFANLEFQSAALLVTITATEYRIIQYSFFHLVTSLRGRFRKLFSFILLNLFEAVITDASISMVKIFVDPFETIGIVFTFASKPIAFML